MGVELSQAVKLAEHYEHRIGAPWSAVSGILHNPSKEVKSIGNNGEESVRKLLACMQVHGDVKKKI